MRHYSVLLFLSSSSSSSYFLFGIVYEKQNVQTLKQARLTSSNTKGNNKISLVGCC